MRRGRHQQQVAGIFADPFREPEASGLLDLRSKEVGGELVSFVEYDQIPSCGTELGLEEARLLFVAIVLFAAGKLIEPNDQQIVILEDVSAGRRCVTAGEDKEGQAELLEQLVLPLINQASGGDDEHAASVCPHDQFADVEPGHDRFAGPGIVGEYVAKRLAGKHRLVNGGDLVRKGIDVRRVNGHHRIEEKGQVDPLGLASELERCCVAVEGPGPLDRGNGNGRFVGGAEKALLETPVGQLVEDLNRVVGVRRDLDDGTDAIRLQANESETGTDFGQFH
jgi:hypothetical protein